MNTVRVKTRVMRQVIARNQARTNNAARRARNPIHPAYHNAVTRRDFHDLILKAADPAEAAKLSHAQRALTLRTCAQFEKYMDSLDHAALWEFVQRTWVSRKDIAAARANCSR